MRAETAAAVATANARLAEPERIVRWALLDDTWQPGGPERPRPSSGGAPPSCGQPDGPPTPRATSTEPICSIEEYASISCASPRDAAKSAP